ncbi:DUF4307 domain-containing protein [Umezawaea endophytica]|uniref:DUF4307 domain-containing protein n=1 Tax=Umezawaea endophytica TaxID=1654476 RepID=A0A9X2VNP4_9PSEU|nr:DUF4307 domain-containing protein [Umezawaea endophytica]MCS7479870.1 DUF4307 domain-containing protein [Umezawaea endophytica]
MTGVAQRTLPDGRYGKQAGKPLPKWLRWSLPVVGVLVGAVVALVAYQNLGNQPIEAKQSAFEVLDDSSVEVTFEVVRDEPDQPVVCVIRARSDDGDEAGRREVLVPPGRSTSSATTVLRTSKPPVTGEVFGCSYQVPAYLSTR